MTQPSKNNGKSGIIACVGMMLFSPIAATAGDGNLICVTDPPSSWDWCGWLSGKPGLVFKNEENPLLKELLIEGRYQYQAAYVSGSDVNGNDFHSTYDEHRRVRLGARAKFGGHFSTKIILNLVNDGRRNGDDLDWGYDNFDEALVSFDIGKALGAGPFDSLVLNYGRHKFVLSNEARESSARILTIERSAISNKVYGSARPTGFTLDAKRSDWSWTLGYYGPGRNGGDNGFLSGFHGGGIYFAHAGWQATKALRLNLDTVYNDTDFGADSSLKYRWAMSLNTHYNAGSWGLITDAILGDNGGNGNGVAAANRQGTFWGVVVMPYFWIAEEKLQGVLQYQYGGASQGSGVQINGRYGSSGKSAPADVNGGRGDEHHSLYAGINYHLCGHNAKVQGGIEYQTMNTSTGTRGKFDTLTWLVAFRGHF